MRLVDLTRSVHHIRRGLDRIYKIYDNVDEALSDGVNPENVLYWKLVEDNPIAIEKIGRTSQWIITDDKFVPDYFDVKEYKVVFKLDSNGNQIPTTGCVIQATEYLKKNPGKAFSNNFLRTPTGTFVFKMLLTSEIRKRTLSLSKHISPWSSPGNITKKKRRAALALLSPLSPTYGRIDVSFLVAYPHFKTSKSWKLKAMSLKFFNQRWFYKLIKRDYLMSMLVQDVKSELEKKGMDYKYIADKIELAMRFAEKSEKAKDIISVLQELKSYLEKDTSSQIQQPTEQQLPPGASFQLEPHVDGEPLEQKAETEVFEALKDIDVVSALDDEGDVIESKIIGETGTAGEEK